MAGIPRSALKIAGLCAVMLLASCKVSDVVSNTGAGIASGGVDAAYRAGSSVSVQWARAIGDIDAAPDEIDGISVDNAGNTVIAGVFRGKVNIASSNFNSVGGDDIFLASFNRSGSLNWAKATGSSGPDNIFDVTTDGAGNIYASGWFSGTVDFGGQSLQSAGSVDAFVAKYNSAGGLIWAKSFGGPAGEGGNEISVTSNGEIAVSMMSSGTTVIDGRSFTFGGGKRDAYVIRMDTNGNVRWVSHVNSGGTERIRALAMAPSGDVYLGFQFNGAVRVTGADGSTRALNGAGQWDGALARLNPQGSVQWLLPVMSGNIDNVRGIGVGSDNEIYASGMIKGPATVVDRNVPLPKSIQGNKKGIDYVLKVNKAGQFQWIVGVRSKIKAIGGELQASRSGVITSALQRGGAKVFRLDAGAGRPQPVGDFTVPHAAPMSYIAKLSPSGNLVFSYSPDPVSEGSGAFGDVLSLSPNGRYLVQALRFRKSISVGGKTLSTQSKKDSAVLFLNLN
ncbi:MAG: hypothetical protein AB8B82_08110 [Roseovarius sp.]